VDTSIEDLVEVLQISRSSLYDTFGDKRTLFLESLRLYSAGVIERITITLNNASSPIAGIQAVLKDLAEGVGTESGAMGCFMVNSVAELAPYDPDVMAIAVAYSESLLRLLTDALTQGVAEGIVTNHQTPGELAAFVFNTMQGLRILIKSGATREQVTAIGTMTVNLLR